MLGHEHLTTTCRYYLGIIAEADVKAAHAKYLSYCVIILELTIKGMRGAEASTPSRWK